MKTKLLTLLSISLIGLNTPALATDKTFSDATETTSLLSADIMLVSKVPGTRKISGTNLASSISTLLSLSTNYQAKDDTLTALAGVSTVADRLIYATASDTFSVTAFTSLARTLVAASNTATARAALALPGDFTSKAGQFLVVDSGETAVTYFGGMTSSASLPKLKSYTVATLPAASTAGAGAIAFVTDATATTFNSTAAGGGSYKMLVLSDGTNWKLR